MFRRESDDDYYDAYDDYEDDYRGPWQRVVKVVAALVVFALFGLGINAVSPDDSRTPLALDLGPAATVFNAPSPTETSAVLQMAPVPSGVATVTSPGAPAEPSANPTLPAPYGDVAPITRVQMQSAATSPTSASIAPVRVHAPPATATPPATVTSPPAEPPVTAQPPLPTEPAPITPPSASPPTTPPSASPPTTPPSASPPTTPPSASPPTTPPSTSPPTTPPPTTAAPTTVPPTTAGAPGPVSQLVRVVSSADTTDSIREWFRANGLSSLHAHNRSALAVPPLRPGDVITVVDGVLYITRR